VPIAPLPKTPQDEEAALAARVALGEEEALQELHRRYAGLVFHVACKSLDRAAAEEITQDVFLAVWRKASSFDPARGSLRTWLLGIVHHRILDEFRARSRRPAGEAPPEELEVAAQDPLPDEAFWRDYQRRAIAQALEALPEAQRKALRLAFFSDLSHELVAEALEIPLGTAKTRIRSGLRSMSGLLGALVAAVLVALGIPAYRTVRGRIEDSRREGRALDLLANSSLKILKLLPPGAADPGEAGMHAGFRGVPGRDTAVLTLSHFPPPPAGTRYVLTLVRAGAAVRVDLPPPDADGRALKVLEGFGGWPEAMAIAAEGPGTTGAPVVQWKGVP
jgi:RNA polymerase sigma-70 factor (ECF subfamily)